MPSSNLIRSSGSSTADTKDSAEFTLEPRLRIKHLSFKSQFRDYKTPVSRSTIFNVTVHMNNISFTN